MIPLVALHAQYRVIKSEVDAAVLRVRDSAQFILSSAVAALEPEFAACCVLRREVPASAPPHITLLNKELLRLVFLLEGCRSGPDLEAQRDWGNNRRLLVLENL